MNDTTEGRNVQLAAGIILLVLVAGAVTADAVNAFLYGWAISGMAALVYVIGALGVPVGPAVAHVRGWCPLKLTFTASAVAMTIFITYSNYSTGQANTSLTSQTANLNYEKAKAKETRANEVLTKVEQEEKRTGALGSGKELGKIADQADVKLSEAGKTLADAGEAAKKACKKPLSDACTLANADKTKADAAKTVADGEAKLAHVRLALAEARVKAELDLAEAGEATKSGKTAERKESEVLTWLSIALTQLVALLSGEAFAMIGGALQARKAAREAANAPKPKKAPAPANPTGGESVPLTGNVVPLNLRRHSVEAWLRSATRKGGELKGGEAFKAYQRWPEADKGLTAPELRAILAAICGEALAARCSGYVVRGISLRTAAPAAQPRAAAAR